MIFEPFFPFMLGAIYQAGAVPRVVTLEDGDVITIDADSLAITVDITDEEMDARRKAWVAPPFKYTRGTMYRYIKTVSSAQKGCVTDE